MKLKIEYVPIETIKPYAGNAKLHPQEQIDQIKRSIELMGFDDPIAIWKNGEIIEGHGRLIAAQQLEMKTVPIIRLDDLTDEQRRSYALIHNKLTMNSGFDAEVLELELAEISTIDMSAFSFDMDFVQDSGSNSGTSGSEDEYDAEPPAEPKAKPGDVYQLGEHRLMCGDSTNAEHIRKLTGGTKINLALTDPPYGINAVKVNAKSDSQRGTAGGGGKLKFNQNKGTVGGANETHFKSGKVGGESQSTKEENRISPSAVVAARMYLPVKGDESTDTARKYYEATKDITDHQIIFGGNYFTDFLSPSRCWIVWDKNNTGNFADAELAWTDFDKGVKLYRFTWNGLQREGKRSVEGVHRVHPTQKPVGMLQNILNDFSAEGDSVLDCFGGSGSTLIACEQTKRKCFMIEYEAGYVDIIIDRWEKLTGKKAVKLDD